MGTTATLAPVARPRLAAVSFLGVTFAGVSFPGGAAAGRAVVAEAVAVAFAPRTDAAAVRDAHAFDLGAALLAR
jgi:hypothetical protein